MKKIQNFWFYYHKHLLIALAVLLVGGYLMVQNAGKPEPDYHIGLIQAVPCREEYLQELEAELTARGADVNGDGQVLVEIHTYYVDLSDDSANAGITNGDTAAALDADLIGNVSGIFLLEDEKTFRELSNGLLSDSSAPFRDGLVLTIRRDAEEAYRILADLYS